MCTYIYSSSSWWHPTPESSRKSLRLHHALLPGFSGPLPCIASCFLLLWHVQAPNRPAFREASVDRNICLPMLSLPNAGPFGTRGTNEEEDEEEEEGQGRGEEVLTNAPASQAASGRPRGALGHGAPDDFSYYSCYCYCSHCYSSY